MRHDDQAWLEPKVVHDGGYLPVCGEDLLTRDAPDEIWSLKGVAID